MEVRKRLDDPVNVPASVREGDLLGALSISVGETTGRALGTGTVTEP